MLRQERMTRRFGDQHANPVRILGQQLVRGVGSRRNAVRAATQDGASTPLRRKLVSDAG